MKTDGYGFDLGDGLRLQLSSNGWSLRLPADFAIGAQSIGVHLSGGEEVVGSLVDSSNQPFSDPAGSGDAVTARFINDDHELSFTWQMFIYRDRPIVAVSFSATNDGSQALDIEDLFVIDGPLVDGLADEHSCIVLNNGPGLDYAWGAKVLEPVTTHLRPGTAAEAYWSTAIAVPSRGVNLVIGMGDAPTAFPRFVFSREGDNVRLYGAAVQETENTYPYRGDRHTDYPEGGINPILLESGRTISSRYAFTRSESIHTSLDDYADYVRDYVGMETRFGPATGLWGDYASNPAFDGIDPSTITGERLSTVMDILQEKLQKFGLTNIMFTLGVGAAEEHAPDGFDWRAALPDEDRRRVDVMDPDYQGFAKGYRLADHFPDGIRSFTDGIHRRGFKAAFHFTLLTHVKSGPPEWDDLAARTVKRRFLDDWGFDYLYLGSGTTPRNMRRDQTIVEAFGGRLKRIREEVGPDVFILADTASLSSGLGEADGSRGARDFRGGNEVLLLHAMSRRYYYHGKWFWLDSEFYDPAERPFLWNSDVGDFDDGSAPAVITPLERTRSWISVHAIACWSLFVGGALERTSDERFFLLSRALPVYRGRGYPVDLLAEEEPLSVWALRVSQASGEHLVVGLFNWTVDQQRMVSFERGEVVDDAAEYLVFDFWAKRLLGSLRERHEVSLPPFCCQVLFLSKKRQFATLMGSDRHVTGAFAVENWSYDSEAGELTGESTGPVSTEHSLYFHLEEVAAASSAEGCVAETLQPHVLRITIRFDEETTRKWRATLDRNVLWKQKGA